MNDTASTPAAGTTTITPPCTVLPSIHSLRIDPDRRTSALAAVKVLKTETLLDPFAPGTVFAVLALTDPFLFEDDGEVQIGAARKQFRAKCQEATGGSNDFQFNAVLKAVMDIEGVELVTSEPQPQG